MKKFKGRNKSLCINFRWLLELICVIFYSVGLVRKPTPPRGLEGLGDQIPTKTIKKHHPTCSHAPIRGDSFRWDLVHVLVHEGCSSRFFDQFFSCWGRPPFQSDSYNCLPDLITKIRDPVIFKLFPTRSGFFNNQICVIKCLLLFPRQILQNIFWVWCFWFQNMGIKSSSPISPQNH